MEVHDGRRRPRGSREYILKIYLMSIVADDYENFEMVIDTVREWAAEDGLGYTLEEILRELRGLTSDGDIQTYTYMTDKQELVVAVYDEMRVNDLWFMLTPAGIQAMNKLDSQSE